MCLAMGESNESLRKFTLPDWTLPPNLNGLRFHDDEQNKREEKDSVWPALPSPLTNDL
jgi:hypothetical protein